MTAIHMKKGYVSFFLAFAVLLLWLYLGHRQESMSHICATNDQLIKPLKDHYCNPLSSGAVTGHEGLVPKSKYNLELVQIVIRHGDRYYINPVPNYNTSNISCIIEQSLIDHVPQLKDYAQYFFQTMKSQSAHSHQDHPLYGYELFPNQQHCDISMLTPVGAAQHIRNALFLRSVYIDNWKILKLTEPFNKQILMRSTKWARCVQSGLAFMYGFIPQFHLNDIYIERVESNNMCLDGVTVPSCKCVAVEPYKDTMSVTFDQTNRAFLGQKHVHQLHKDLADLLEVDIKIIPKLGHLLDIAMVHQCHDTSQFVHKDKCMTPELIQKLHIVMSENGQHNLVKPSFKRLAHIKMHPLLTEIYSRMTSIVLDLNNTIRFVLYSAHDTTLEPLAAMLGVSDGMWPRYAARLVVEFYTSTGIPRDLSHAFIRVLFDGADVTTRLSFCYFDVVTEGSYSLCPYNVFKEYVEVGNMRDLRADGYENACALNI